MIGRLLKTVQRLRGRSAHEFYFRVAQSAFAWRERTSLSLGVSNDSPISFASGNVADAAQALAQSRPFFHGVENAASTVNAIRAGSSAHVEETLERAARAARGEIAILGHGLINVGSPPQWHREPIAGLTAPKKHWSEVPYLDPRVVGDHKVVWEFNRHQYFVTLGQAWKYSQNELWPRVFAEHLLSWIDENPPTVGMNWASSLEVSYRAISWMWAFQLMRDASVLRGAFAERVLGSVQAHGRHLERNLSTYFSPNTHLTGEALGLFYIGTQCPMLRDAQRWRNLGAEVLESALSRQVLKDGVYFEQATQYHRYTIEIYLHYLLLARANNLAVSSDVEKALHKMFDVLLHLTRADGTIPLVGDDDGGRLVQLDNRLPHDVRSLHAIGAVVLERSDLAWVGQGDDAALYWMLGHNAVQERDALIVAPPEETARGFVNGGLFTMRDGWSSADGHIAIDSGPHGALSFGHSHADALSVELAVGGRPLFVDAGTFTYVGNERDTFRSTSAHNTIEVDGESACVPSTPFRWETVSHARPISWVADEQFSYFSGVHDGYGRLAIGHQRSVLHPAPGLWVVRDDLTGAGHHALNSRWHCAPDVTATVVNEGNGWAEVVLSRDGQATATAILAGGSNGKAVIEKGWVSPQYGAKIEIDICSWQERITGNATLVSVVIDGGFYPADEITPVRASLTSKGLQLSFSSRNNGDEFENTILVGAGVSMNVGDITVDASISYVRASALTRKSASIIAVGAKTVATSETTVLEDSTGQSWLVAKSESLNGRRSWSTRRGAVSLPAIST